MRGPRWKMSIRGAMGLVAASAVIFGIVAAIGDAREVAHRKECESNLRQIGLSLHQFATTNEEFPVGSRASVKVAPDMRLGWLFVVLDFIDQNRCLEQFDPDEPYDSPTNAEPIVECQEDSGRVTREKLPVQEVKIFRCPSRPILATRAARLKADIVGITGLGPDSASLPTSHPRAGVFGSDRHVRFGDIQDGLSQTMMIAETSVTTGPWTSAAATLRAVDPARRPYLGPGRDFGGNHADGGLVSMVDGSVKFVRDSTDPKVFEALSTIAGGEVIAGTEITSSHPPRRRQAAGFWPR